jgi:RNA polymerase sigma factor (sigma-70 family)
MATAQLGAVQRVLDRVRSRVVDDHGDGELLHRWRRDRDQEAFAALVQRHGGLVLGVCRRVLRDPHAAEDAFQVTFLVLAKRADAVRPPGVLGPWLHGVAYRTALKARGRAFRRQQIEQDYAARQQERRGADAPRLERDADLRPVIDEQLNALPEKYRVPLVLCGVQGLGKAEAAERLGLPEGTVSSRLARGREMLRDRLTRRGVIVPAAAIAACLAPNALRAAVPTALATSAAQVAVGVTPISPALLTLSHEVLRTMTLVKFKLLAVVAFAVAITGGGLGVYTVRADDKKPLPEKPAVDKPAPEKPAKPGEKPVKPGTDAEKPKPATDDPAKPKPEKPVKPGDPDKPKPEKPTGDKPKPEKPAADKPKPEKPIEKPGPVALKGWRIVGVDPKGGTITLSVKGDGGVVEKFYKVAADANVFIDGKLGELKNVPKGAIATLVFPNKEGAAATEVHVTGPTVTGMVAKADESTVTIDIPDKQGITTRVFKLVPGGKIQIAGMKDTKLADLKPGDKAAVTLTVDESAAVAISAGRPGADREKPDKPAKAAAKFGGKVSSVDPAARTINLAAKGEAGKEIVVRLTADAKVLIDGKEAKLSDVPKGAMAQFTIASAKDGQPREASAVLIAGPTFGGAVKQIDRSEITIGNEKADRVLKLLPTTKVVIGGKDAKVADLKVGDRVNVTLSSDETAAVLITGGVKRDGDKEPEDDDNQ